MKSELFPPLPLFTIYFSLSYYLYPAIENFPSHFQAIKIGTRFVVGGWPVVLVVVGLKNSFAPAVVDIELFGAAAADFEKVVQSIAILGDHIGNDAVFEPDLPFANVFAA